MKKLVIVGAGEIAHCAYEYFTHDSDYRVVGFAVSREYLRGGAFLDLPLIALEELEGIYPAEEFSAFVALGNGQLNRERTRLFLSLKERGYTLASYVSSKAFVWHNVEIGENCFILEHNVLQPFTKVCDNVTMWSGNHLGHRSCVREHCFITSHCVISGYCEIGSYSFLGVNCAVADHIKIAQDNFIALGSVINKNTQENAIYRGNPASLSKIPARQFCKVKEDIRQERKC